MGAARWIVDNHLDNECLLPYLSKPAACRLKSLSSTMKILSQLSAASYLQNFIETKRCSQDCSKEIYIRQHKKVSTVNFFFHLRVISLPSSSVVLMLDFFECEKYPFLSRLHPPIHLTMLTLSRVTILGSYSQL